MSETMRWFPFYIDRFLTSKRVRRMDAQQVGVYLLLLLDQWDNGPIGDDPDDLTLVAKADHGTAMAVLQECFKKTRKGWINETLEDVRREQQRKIEMKKTAGAAGAKARWGQGENSNRMAPPMRPQCDSNGIRSRSRSREEKRTSRGKPSTRARAWKFVPQDWQPTEKHAALAKELQVDLRAEEAKFRDHEFKDPKTDADRAFSRWLRTAPQYANGNGAVGRGRETGVVKRFDPPPPDVGPDPSPEQRAKGIALVRDAVKAVKTPPKPCP